MRQNELKKLKQSKKGDLKENISYVIYALNESQKKPHIFVLLLCHILSFLSLNYLTSHQVSFSEMIIK